MEWTTAGSGIFENLALAVNRNDGALLSYGPRNEGKKHFVKYSFDVISERDQATA